MNAQTDGEETRDSLLGDRVSITQPAQGYRVSIDAVLLAASVSPDGDATVLDVGCGHGGATLCLAYRAAHARLHGIDVRPEAVARFTKNVALNGWHDRMSASIVNVADDVVPEYASAFDWVISNPPYLPVERMDRRAADGPIDPATTETVPLRRWLGFMTSCLNEGGHLALIHRADRIVEVLANLSELAGAIEIFPIWPKTGAPAKRILVKARKGVHGPAKIHAGLVLHEGDGAFTPAARAVLVDGAALRFDQVGG